jgi:para-aminobenzoate synthetase component 1
MLTTTTGLHTGSTVKLHCTKLTADISLDAVTEVFSKRKHSSILGGNSADCNSNRFSTWAAAPKHILQCDASEADPLDKLQNALARYRLDIASAPKLPEGMFPGGWIGYFSYDLDRFIENVPKTAADDLGLPLLRLCFYDSCICYDHLQKTWYLIALEMPEDGQRPAAKIARLAELLRQANNTTVKQPPHGDLHNIDTTAIDCNMTTGQYFDSLQKIRRYIYEGDVYQINFSQRFACDYDRPPVDLYHWQNRYNPSPYAAYIDAGVFSIVSASPEMFLTVRNGVISTKPVKGTRRRLTSGAGAEKVNQVNFTELVQSHKDQAELYMIIDLERNDLARICVPGTRFVSQPRTIETYPTVYHAVATIEGKLKPSCTFTDILRATFPGGSITGAPKIRSMEIIDELEPTQRSVYTGSIGYIGVDGSLCLNIAIRTVIVQDGKAYAQTGGGIVADSDPKAEYEETITKARALLAGIKAVNEK